MANKNFISGGELIVLWSCGAKEMATVARVGNAVMGRVVDNERIN